MQLETADVSVIMPAYHAAATIGRALASIAAQTLPPREVIVVDDGSADGTHEAAVAMTSRMNGIQLKVLRQLNQGAGAARNRALAEAAGRFVAFLDADDEWLPAKLERSMAYLRTGTYVLVAHDGWVVDGDGTSALDCSVRFQRGRDPFVELYRRGYIDTCSVVARRDAVMAAGAFDHTLPAGQDFDLFLAMLGRPNAPFLVFPERLVRYHITPGSITSNTLRRLRCQLRIIDRHAPTLRHFPGWRLGSIWFRILAVHYEAVRVLAARRDVAKLTKVAGSLAAALPSLTIRALRR